MLYSAVIQLANGQLDARQIVERAELERIARRPDVVHVEALPIRSTRTATIRSIRSLVPSEIHS